jgi:hypothetical protein
VPSLAACGVKAEHVPLIVERAAVASGTKRIHRIDRAELAEILRRANQPSGFQRRPAATRLKPRRRANGKNDTVQGPDTLWKALCNDCWLHQLSLSFRSRIVWPPSLPVHRRDILEIRILKEH